jgi:hypothetical protein
VAIIKMETGPSGCGNVPLQTGEGFMLVLVPFYNYGSYFMWRTVGEDTYSGYYCCSRGILPVQVPPIRTA